MNTSQLLIKTHLHLRERMREMNNDRGMSTIEYAMGSLAAAALAAVLYLVVNGNGVIDAIEGIITEALSNSPN